MKFQTEAFEILEALDAPLTAEAYEGEVLIRSPGSNWVEVAMTPAAILNSLDDMRRAAHEAITQRARLQALS